MVSDPNNAVRRLFLVRLASSTSIKAPLDRDVLMTGIESALKSTLEAARTISVSVTAGLSFLLPAPVATRVAD